VLKTDYQQCCHYNTFSSIRKYQIYYNSIQLTNFSCKNSNQWSATYYTNQVNFRNTFRQLVPLLLTIRWFHIFY